MFLKAIYCLYDEKGFNHRRACYGLRSAQRTTTKATAEFWWDEEGRIIVFRFQRDLATDLVAVEVDSYNGQFHYLVAGTDLCYAAAKACTQTLKRYGFCGYGLDSGDYLDLDHFLFVKAHALGAETARQIKAVWQAPNSWEGASGTDFDAELALLLFDM